MPRLTLLSVFIALLMLVGCAPEDDAVLLPIQNNPITTPPDPSGRVESGTSGSPTVRHVSVTPATLTLNAPDVDGNTPVGFAAAATISAEAVLSNGQRDPKGITWSISDARLRLDADGTLRVLPGAAAGSTVIKAVAVGDSSRTASIPIIITDNGQLRLQFSPALPLLSSDAYRVTVTRGGISVHQGNYKGTTRLTLPAGTNYSVLVERVVGQMTTTSDSSSSVTVSSNTLSTLDFNLE
ncbi:hypothetical protein J7643_11745 [bacterium]|nr:hypothetical protein [bacterium]